jgi:aspartate carbamoyltransferase regulatory subunit
MTSTIRTLPVSAIHNGSVIDHIPAGQALTIVRLLKLAKQNKQVTLGLNLPSNKLEYKDLIKVEALILSTEEASQVAILAPSATVNIIRDYKVCEKFQVSLPAQIKGVIPCQNPQCVSNHEPIAACLDVIRRWKGNVRLQCRFCRKNFSQQDIL